MEDKIAELVEKALNSPEFMEWFIKLRRRILCEIKLGRIENPLDEPIDLNRL